MATTGRNAARAVGASGVDTVVRVSVAGVNASFTGGDTLAVTAFDALSADSADTLAVDLGQGISFIGKSAGMDV